MSWFWQPFEPDQVAAPAEPSILAPFHVRLAFKELRRSPYLRHAAQDLDAPLPEPPTPPPHLVRIAFKPLGRNPYLRNTAQDQSAPGAPDAPVPHLVRVPFKPFSRNRYLHNPSVEGPTQLNDASAGFLVVPSWDGFRLVRASRYVYHHRAHISAPIEASTFAQFFVRVPFRPLRRSRYLNHFAQDSSFVAPIEASTFAAHFVRLPFRPLRRSRYLHHYAQDTSSGPTFQPAWAQQANTLLRTGWLR